MRNRRSQWAAFSLFSFQDIITSVMGIVILLLMVSALELVSRELESPAAQNSLVRSDLKEAIAEARAKLARIQRAIKAGTWDDLAKLTPAEIDRELTALGRQFPVLEGDLKSIQQRLAQVQSRRQKAAAILASRRPDEQQLRSLQQELSSIEHELGRITSVSALFYRQSDSGGRQAWMVQVSGNQILAARLGPKGPATDFNGNTAESRRKQFVAWARDHDPGGVFFVLLIKPGGVTDAKKIEEALRTHGFGVGLDLIGPQQTAVDSENGAPLIDQSAGASS